MACGAAVIATATGGIPEVVVPGETGWLVPIDQLSDGSGTPKDPEKFITDFAGALVTAIESDNLEKYGKAGRERAINEFSWETIATRTLEVYNQALQG
jgi:starch synthase